jgi:alpha-glutamyl/putrescinyl thymine pyrophosphorylase clade 1
MDPVMASHRFTNAYRAADRVSQYLIRHVIFSRGYNVCDLVFRVLLFKLFNKPATWILLEKELGDLVADRFSVDEFDRVLNDARSEGAKLYSSAYIMPSGPVSARQPRKHRMHLELLAALQLDRFPDRLANASTMADAYALLLQVPSIGPFLAYQFVTDLNYSDLFAFSEMEFVVPGPGARDGLRKCFASFGDYSEADVIRWVADRQNREFETREIKFESLWGRPLQLIDCQNLFCEVDKYARVVHPEVSGYSGRTRIKQKFASTLPVPRPWFPPKWAINARIEANLGPESTEECSAADVIGSQDSVRRFTQTELDLQLAG